MVIKNNQISNYQNYQVRLVKDLINDIPDYRRNELREVIKLRANLFDDNKINAKALKAALANL